MNHMILTDEQLHYLKQMVRNEIERVTLHEVGEDYYERDLQLARSIQDLVANAIERTQGRWRS